MKWGLALVLILGLLAGSCQSFSVGDALRDAASTVGDALGTAADATGDALGTAANATGSFVSNAVDTVGDGIDTALGAVSDAADDVGTFLKGNEVTPLVPSIQYGRCYL